MESQADGWTHATDELLRFYDEIHGRMLPTDGAPRSFLELAAIKAPPKIHEAIGAYLDTATSLGRRTGELHLALAMDSTDVRFPRNHSARKISSRSAWTRSRRRSAP